MVFDLCRLSRSSQIHNFNFDDTTLPVDTAMTLHTPSATTNLQTFTCKPIILIQVPQPLLPRILLNLIFNRSNGDGKLLVSVTSGGVSGTTQDAPTVDFKKHTFD